MKEESAFSAPHIPASAFAPGKIILSGEYAVVFGEPGIAIPASIGMTVRYEEDVKAEGMMIEGLGSELHPAWKQYVGRIIAECAAWKGDAMRGRLTINNALPLGKGMGSSTALVITVSRALLGEECYDEAKKIEDAMNPGNSGLDFAVIWANKPVRFVKGQPPIVLSDITFDLPHLRLIDTGTPHEATHELVAWIKERSSEPAIKKALKTIGHCTKRLLDGESPFTVFPDHHRAQVALGIVPPQTQAIIEEIEREGGAAKVIGAGAKTGGGGMVVAVHP